MPAVAAKYADWARVAEAAADRARQEILPRFRDVAVETKADGSPVTEADRSAETRDPRHAARAATPDFGLLGEEFGADDAPDRPYWVIDPIDGTIAFSRGIPLFSTLIALVEDGEPVLGLIDLPALGERYVGWKGGGCRRDGVPVQRLPGVGPDARAIVSHGDPFAFDRFGAAPPASSGWRRGSGCCGATPTRSVTRSCWEAGSTPWWTSTSTRGTPRRVSCLVPEAGGRCVTLQADSESASARARSGSSSAARRSSTQLLRLARRGWRPAS